MQSSEMIDVIEDAASGGGVVYACRGKARSEHRRLGSGVFGTMLDADAGYVIAAMRMPATTWRFDKPT